MGLTWRPLQDGAKKRLIAYHEVGHALLTTLVPHADKLDKVTLLPRAGGVGGFARMMPDEDILDSGLITKAYLQARLVVALGGRAAEIVVFGASEVTQGASGDLLLVSRICREMVTRYGFSSLGPVALEGDGAEVFLGRDLIHTRPGYADRTGREIDLRVRSWPRRRLIRRCHCCRPAAPCSTTWWIVWWRKKPCRARTSAGSWRPMNQPLRAVTASQTVLQPETLKPQPLQPAGSDQRRLTSSAASAD